MKPSIAVVGEIESTLSFRAAGCEALEASAADVRSVLKKAVKEYRVVFLIDTFYPQCADIIAQFDAGAYPIVLPIPGRNGASPDAAESLVQIGERALGVNILNR